MEAKDIIVDSRINFALVRTSGIFSVNESTGKSNFLRGYTATSRMEMRSDWLQTRYIHLC